jgi:hypothetical protein
VNALFWFSYVLLWVLLAVVALGVLALYHHFGQAYVASREGRASQGPAEGTQLRRAEATGLDGAPVLLPPRGSPALLVFTSTTCRVCESMRLELIQVAREEFGVPVYVFCQGSPGAVRQWAGKLGDVATVVADQRLRITTRYEVAMTPFAIAVDATSTVRARGIVNDADGLRLFTSAAQATQTAQADQADQEAPTAPVDQADEAAQDLEEVR